MPIRAVLCDLGDTLFRLDPISSELPARIVAACCRAIGDAGEPVARGLFEAVRAELAAGYLAGQTVENQVPALVERHLPAGAPRALAERIAALYWQADIERFRHPAENVDAIRALRDAGLTLVAVSNTTTPPERLSAYLASVGLLGLFAGTVFSVDLGLRKPHPAIYERALALAGCEPAEALFVGDRVREDIIGPQSLGIPAVLTHQFRQETPTAATPLAVVTHLDQLPSILAQFP